MGKYLHQACYRAHQRRMMHTSIHVVISSRPRVWISLKYLDIIG
jgi:hypothetical protein